MLTVISMRERLDRRRLAKPAPATASSPTGSLGQVLGTRGAEPAWTHSWVADKSLGQPRTRGVLTGLHVLCLLGSCQLPALGYAEGRGQPWPPGASYLPSPMSSSQSLDQGLPLGAAGSSPGPFWCTARARLSREWRKAGGLTAFTASSRLKPQL